MTRRGSETRMVAGVDEAGRGPWAGPVVAAAVVLGAFVPDGLADSKRLSPKARERLFSEIMTGAEAVAFRIASARRIDRADILRATLQAMRQCVLALPVKPHQVYVDGTHIIPGVDVPQRAVVRGDALVPEVSAAGIVAKVIRDRIMRTWDRAWPAYGFAAHKGYGTREHLRALLEHGPCPLHRFSFAPVRRATERSGGPGQETNVWVSK